jgi:hypothetical protein
MSGCIDYCSIIENKLMKILLTVLESNKIESTKEVPAEWTSVSGTHY